MITKNYKISYFCFNFDRKSTYGILFWFLIETEIRPRSGSHTIQDYPLFKTTFNSQQRYGIQSKRYEFLFYYAKLFYQLTRTFVALCVHSRVSGGCIQIQNK